MFPCSNILFHLRICELIKKLRSKYRPVVLDSHMETACSAVSLNKQRKIWFDSVADELQDRFAYFHKISLDI
jgi:hypothetical protein